MASYFVAGAAVVAVAVNTGAVQPSPEASLQMPVGIGAVGSKYHVPVANPPAWQCMDTPNWVNKEGLTCKDYKTKGYCTGQGFAAGSEWTAGETYNYPESNCCDCLDNSNVDSVPDTEIPYRANPDGTPAWATHKTGFNHSNSSHHKGNSSHHKGNSSHTGSSHSGGKGSSSGSKKEDSSKDSSSDSKEEDKKKDGDSPKESSAPSL